MKKKNQLKKLTVATLATVAGLQFTSPAHAADVNTPTADNANTSQAAEIEALKKEVQELAQKINTLQNQPPVAQPAAANEELDQKVRILEREREIDKEDAAALAKTQPKISLSANGFSFSSADTNFVLNLHGLLQLDSRTFLHDNPKTVGNDGFILRRARPILTGTLFHDFDFNFTPDFGGSTANGANPVQIQDAYLNYRYNPAIQLEIGKFKSPVGLEQLQTDNYVSFNERSIANNLIPNRDLGAELHGDLLDGTLNYAAGIFNGATDYNGTTSNQDSDDNKSFAGRLFAQPWKNTSVDALRGFGFGVGGSYGFDSKGSAGLTPGYKTDGQQTFFAYSSAVGNVVTADGTHWRVSPQAYYYYGPFNLLGEYVVSDQGISLNTAGASKLEVQNTSWELSTGWVLTGEDAGYNGVTPRNPFNLRSGGLGAWQVVARYAEVDVDNDVFSHNFQAAGSASEAQAWSVGLNWYLNKSIRVSTSFSRTTFSKYNGATTAITAQPENVLFTRVQLAF